VPATIYRWRPWGEERIEVPIKVAPLTALQLADGDVVGGVGGQDGSAVVTFAGKRELSAKTTEIDLDVSHLGAGSYEGSVDLLPASEEGDVTLKLTVKDWWPLAALAVAAGIVLGLAAQRFVNVVLPKNRLNDEVDNMTVRHNDATALLAQQAADAGNKPWGGFAISDLKTKQDEIKRAIARETRLYYLDIDDKVVEALDAKISSLEEQIDQLDAIHEKMTALDDALQAIANYPRIDLPLRDEDMQRDPVWVTRTRNDVLHGTPLTIAQLKERLTGADAATVTTDHAYGPLLVIAQYYAQLKQLAHGASTDDKKELEPIFEELEQTSYKFWNATTLRQLEQMDAEAELDAIYDLIADVAARRQVSPPIVERVLVAGGGSGAAMTLPMMPGSDQAPVTPNADVADEEAKWVRWRGYGVAGIAFLVALVTALELLYVGKAWGTPWDYIWAVAWGLTAQAVLVTLAGIIGGVAGLRALGRRLRLG
jgi:hypothetical protein